MNINYYEAGSTKSQAIRRMTEAEVNAMIFAKAEPDQLVAMPVEIALEIAHMPHLSQQMQDWAAGALAEFIDMDS